jgi:hypothetical protein
MKFADPPRRNTSNPFRQRAKHYRLAAAVADAPRDVAMFGDLAMMFDRIADHFVRTGTSVTIVAGKHYDNRAQNQGFAYPTGHWSGA